MSLPGARIGLIALSIASVAVLFIDITTKELHGTPVFYAALARELVINNDPFFIFTGPEAYLLKPPLAIWISALSMKWLGFTHAAATLSPRLAGLAVVILTYAVVKRVFDVRVAALAGLVLLTNSTFIQFSTTLRMDPFVQTGILLAVLGWLQRDSNRGSIFIFGGIALALLTKGPVGLLSIVLMALHWTLLPQSREVPINWRWAPLLTLPLAWYGYLWLEHGAASVLSLSDDYMRANANPDLAFAESALLEYVKRPFSRYWPWLPFMVVGLLLPLWQLHRGRLSTPNSRAQLWFVLWCVLVVGSSAIKPDHDIRYLYPALPALAALAGVVLAGLLDVTRGWIVALATAFLLSGAVWLISVHDLKDWRIDLYAMQQHVQKHHANYTNPVVIDAYPITPGSPRRQNTHRDWIYYYLGVEPRIISHGARGKRISSALPYLLTSRSDGYQNRLRFLGFKPLYVTKEMVMAIPHG